MFKKIGFTLLLCLPLATFANESEQPKAEGSDLKGLSLGLGVVASNGIYIGEKTEIIPVPVIGYEINGFFIRGLSAGAEIYKDKMFTVNAIANVNMMNLDVDDLSSTKLALKNIDKSQLEDRDRSIDVGVESIARTPYGLFSLQAVHDVANASEGAELRLNYQYFWRFNPKLNIIPSVGLDWLSNKRANYYYGILDREVELGVQAYKPDSVIIPNISIGASYALNDKVRLTSIVSQKFLPNAVKDSPLIDKSSSLNSYMAVTYSF